jgi:subtilisin family serine protease
MFGTRGPADNHRHLVSTCQEKPMPNGHEIPEVLILRLAGDDSPATLQARIESRVGTIDGELFSWLEGRWSYLSGGYEALLQQRLAGRSVASLCLGSGADEVDRIPLEELQARLSRRVRNLPFLRDAGATGVAPPGVVGAVIIDGSRQVAMDWQLTVTGINAAWSLFDMTPGRLPWADILVGHVDTGCTQHPALGFHDGVSEFVHADRGLNLYSEMLPFPDPDPLANEPPELAGPFDNPGGANGGHGTRTMSVLGGFFDRPDDGDPPFYGAAPGVGVIPYRVTNSVLIDHVQRLMAKAIDDAVAKGCRVISMSLGGAWPYGRLSDAIDRAYEQGVIVCAAAGNIIREVTYPGRYNRVITVGGVRPVGTSGFKPWDGASRGQFVDICGPADGVRRATVELRKGKAVPSIQPDGSGTSYATALCAGVASLWLAKHGNSLDAAYPQKWMIPAAFKRLIKETADLPAGWDTNDWGRGLYRADRLLTAALPAAGDLHHEAPAAAPFDRNA